MFIDIHSTYDTIEKDIVANQSDIFNMYNHYTTKYRGDRLNDVNVGLFLNDRQIPTVQIFVRNKTGYIKKHIYFNRAGTTIQDIQTLNYKYNA